MLHPISSHECSRIAQDLQIRKVQVEAVVQLLDEGNTVPFITRYRKERTGGLNEEVIRQVQTRVALLRQLHDRKQTILKSIETQGKLTDELRQAILAADTSKRLEDLYLPFKPKRKSLAAAAREKGLEPLALAIWHSDPAVGRLEELLPSLLNPEKELKTIEDVQKGVQHILAEMIAETAEIRHPVRTALWATGKICSSRNDKLPEGKGLEYKDYFNFQEGARDIPSHRILALNRAEKEGAVKVRFEWDKDKVHAAALKALADVLLKKIGQTPLPASPSPPPKPSETIPAADTPTCSQTAPADSTPTHASEPSAEASHAAHSGDSSAASDAAVDASSTPGATATTAAAETPADTTSTPNPPEAKPLVESLPAAPKIEMTGEQLAPDAEFKSPHAAFLRLCLDDAIQRLLVPSLEREIRNELTDEAEFHAIMVFARNLRSLLLQPPLRDKRVLAIDPAFRTGCKIAALDEIGNLLDQSVIYPFAPPPKKVREKEKKDAAPEPAKPESSAAPEAPAPSPTETSPESPVTQATSTPSDAPVPVATETPAIPTPEAHAIQAAALPGSPPSTEMAAPVPTESPSPAEAAVADTPAADVPTAEAKPPAESTTPEIDKKAEAKARLLEFIHKNNIHVIALGNGTGCRETEEMVAEVISTGAPDVSYVIVNEAGASHYSVSQVGREEFPGLSETVRGTISIGRRLQDPLSELVKVDPQNIGVGLYQHDMGRKELKESLDAVVESCVNQVGVDVNTASVPLLRHVSGLNQLTAREIVEYRRKHGPFTSREQLRQVPNLGDKRFEQAAGFLKIPASANPFDKTWIHPESYATAEKILAEIGYTPNVLEDRAAQSEFQAKLRSLNAEELAKKLEVGAPTVHDIIEALLKPGRDPREDLPPPIFKKGILRLDDLQPGIELKGTVLNVVDFGVFVDIGLKESGLVHISRLANRYIKSPYDVVAVNDIVRVWVEKIDKERNRVSLTMIEPGTERKPGERRGAPPRGQGAPAQGERRDGGRPPRGRHPAFSGAPPQEGVAAATPSPATHGHGPQTARVGQRPHQKRFGDRGPYRPQQPNAGSAAQAPPPRPQTPPAPPRKPRREPPKPKLSQAAMQGKEPLRTFSELSVFFQKKPDDKMESPKEEPTPPPAPPEQPPPS
jgi:uncharacterized protein